MTNSLHQEYLLRLIDTINDTCNNARNAFNLLMAISLFIGALVLGTDDELLFRDSGTTIPYVGVPLKLSTAFLLAPLLYLLVYALLTHKLNKLRELTDTFDGLTRNKPELKNLLEPNLKNLLRPFFYLEITAGVRQQNKSLPLLMTYIIPMVLLFAILLKFLPYQDLIISGVHLISLLCVAILYLYREKRPNRFIKYFQDAPKEFFILPFKILRFIILLQSRIIKIFIYKLPKAVFYATPISIYDFITKGKFSTILQTIKQGFLTLKNIPDFFTEERLHFCKDKLFRLSPILLKYGGVFIYFYAWTYPYNNRQVFNESLGEFHRYLNYIPVQTALSLPYKTLVAKETPPEILAEAFRMDKETYYEERKDLSSEENRELEKSTKEEIKLQRTNYDLIEKKYVEKLYLRDRNFRGINLTDAKLYQIDLQNSDLTGAITKGANFYKATLQGTILPKANLFRADLSGKALSQANLSGANLYRANLYRADLSRADLSRADLSLADLSGADLSLADLFEAKLFSADLSRTNLSETNLSLADLRWADLSEADLSEADLSGTKLLRANFSEANLSGTDLSKADLFWADLKNAYFNSKIFNNNRKITKFPSDLSPKKHGMKDICDTETFIPKSHFDWDDLDKRKEKIINGKRHYNYSMYCEEDTAIE